MNVPGVVASGFIATAVMTTLMSASQGFGLSRLSFPYIIGTMFTPNRDLAMPLGFAVHFLNGWLVALVYAFLFEQLGCSSWWAGALFGLLHGLALFVAIMPVLPHIHPRMASERQGPDPTRALEPPGMLALHYGRRTPIVGIATHVLYGLLLGLLYQPASL